MVWTFRKTELQPNEIHLVSMSYMPTSVRYSVLSLSIELQPYTYQMSEGGACYMELQAVDMTPFSSLITSSAHLCSTPYYESPSCSSYSDCSLSAAYTPPQSPENESSDENLSDISDILKKCERKDRDDDDESVVFEIDNLDEFLNNWSTSSASDSYQHVKSTDHYTPMVQNDFNLQAISHQPFVDGQVDLIPITRNVYFTSRTHQDHHPPPQTTLWSSQGFNHIPHNSDVFPISPSSSPKYPSNDDDAHVLEQAPSTSELEEEEDDEYKPYCDSRRGAKKNLLWKFLLHVLEVRRDLAQWTDMEKGIFKFTDTARISTLWGLRKQKKDMTFEKLSRGIRHYYKRGLMERLSNTRLVYKFNWEKVPKKYRKA